MFEEIPSEVIAGWSVRYDEPKKTVFIECSTEKLLAIAEGHLPAIQQHYFKLPGCEKVTLFSLESLEDLAVEHGDYIKPGSPQWLGVIWQNVLDAQTLFLRPLFSSNCELKKFDGTYAMVQINRRPMAKVIHSRRDELARAFQCVWGRPVKVNLVLPTREVLNRPPITCPLDELPF